MRTLTFGGKRYQLDDDGFLSDGGQWDEAFAASMAPTLEISGGLTAPHWRVIHFIRDSFHERGKCPLIYQTCRANGLRLKDLQALFPTGYLRGACKLAGITYKEGFHGSVSIPASLREPSLSAEEPAPIPEMVPAPPPPEKTYRVDVRGFLADPAEWDEHYAAHKAFEMGMPEGLTGQHWKVILYLRNSFYRKGVVPTVFETCEANQLEIEDLEQLFPAGYHRGAIKIAGLRVR